MEKIIKFKKLIEEALAKYDGFEVYVLPSSRINVFSDMPKTLKSSKDIKIGEKAYLNDFQREFIEAQRKAENSLAFLKKELQRIELLFSLPTYSVEFPVRIRDGKTQEIKRTENQAFYYDFSAIEEDLPQGRINWKSQHGVVSHLLATANFYLWLKEQEKEMLIEYPTPAQGKRLIWNGAKNALADVFYQLKNLNTDEKGPFLDASYERIAEFLKMNFECFNDTQIRTIKEYLEKDEKRPKKSTNKISVMRGSPPKN